jgi:hypothetical protein
MKSLLNLYKLTHVYSEHKTRSQGSSIRRGFSIVEQTHGDVHIFRELSNFLCQF